MPSLNLITAWELLGICRQRIQQLIAAHRVISLLDERILRKVEPVRWAG